MRKPWHEMLRSNYEVERIFGKEMLPCPFCGSHNVGLHFGPIPHVECIECDASGSAFEKGGKLDLDLNRDRAIRAWNAAPRPQPIEMKREK